MKISDFKNPRDVTSAVTILVGGGLIFGIYFKMSDTVERLVAKSEAVRDIKVQCDRHEKEIDAIEKRVERMIWSRNSGRPDR
jgi:hypothetical protein